MEDVENIVLKMVGSQTNQNQYNLFKMKACWADIIGDNNARHCSPVKLERRILTLQVDSSVWSNQFVYYKSQFIRQINMFMGTCYVKDIRFILGRNFKKSKAGSGKVKIHPTEEKLLIPSISAEQKKGLQQKFSHISNEKIKNAIISVEEKRLGLEKLANDGKIKKCPVCGVYLKNKEDICHVCERKRVREMERKIWNHIRKEPWIRWYDLNKSVKCNEEEFLMIRNDIKMFYFEKIRLHTATGEEEKLGVQLKAEKPLALIKENEYVNILNYLKKGK